MPTSALLSINTLQQAIQKFSDEQTCIDTVAAMRWPDGVTCPACGHKEHWYLKTQKRWKCKDCHRQFSVKLGTIFEDSPIGLDKWLLAMWMIASCKNGVSSYEIHRAIGVTQKSAWFMLHRLRLGMKEGKFFDTPKLGGDGGEVEVDETFIGGKLRNMHKDKQLRFRKTHESARNPGGPVGKAIVVGMLDRTARKIRANVVPDVSRQTLQNAVLQNVFYGTSVYTDQAPAYHKLNSKYVHEIVNHAETYVRGRVHTNGLENFWSLLKRNLSGTYVCVEPFHLDRYVDEQVFRFNNRGSKENPVDGERFRLLLSQIAGKRLTYSALTGKDSLPAPEPF
jgi:transposase-like protein